jgi:hypothetical protein
MRLMETDETIDTIFSEAENQDDLQAYYAKKLIIGLSVFGHDRIDALLEKCPGFDINTKIYRADICLPYCEHLNDISTVKRDKNNKPYTDIADNRFPATIVVDDRGFISFYGGVMQYAILRDDLDLVRHLSDLGATVSFEINGSDVSRDYINSEEMTRLVSELRQREDGARTGRPKHRGRIRNK